MMILALGFRRTKETHHAVRVKGRGSTTQRAFRKASLLPSFSRRNPVEYDGPHLFIEPLFRRSTPLDQQLIVVGAFSPLALGGLRRALLLSERKTEQGKMRGIYQVSSPK